MRGGEQDHPNYPHAFRCEDPQGLSLEGSGRIGARHRQPALHSPHWSGDIRKRRQALPMQRLANPTRFLQLADRLRPALWGLTVVLFAAGLIAGLFFAPADYQQGETVRIMFVHVPAAWL